MYVLFLCLRLLLFNTPDSIPKNAYGLNVISDLDTYRRHCVQHPSMCLVDIQKEIPSIVLDLRYATRHNFTQKPLYKVAKAYGSRAMVDTLKRIQEALRMKGLGIKIYDAYRPYKISVQLFNTYRNPTFVAPPKKGSRHNRGCALDLTLISLRTGRELRMPTDFDAFSRQARYNAVLKDKVATYNRDLLMSIMHKHHFRVTHSEWWHFDFEGYSLYPILDLDFEDLE